VRKALYSVILGGAQIRGGVYHLRWAAAGRLFVSNKAGQIEPAADLIRGLIARDSRFARHPVSSIRFGSEGSKAKKAPY